MGHSKRKRNYVDGHVQGALLRRIFGHWVFFFSVSALAVVSLQTLLGDPGVSVSDRIRSELAEFSVMGVVMLSLLPAFMLDTVRFSNRFVGPIGRFRRHLRELKNGEINQCNFRDGDYWTEMAVEFNDIASLVESQQQEIARLQNLVQADGVEVLG